MYIFLLGEGVWGCEVACHEAHSSRKKKSAEEARQPERRSMSPTFSPTLRGMFVASLSEEVVVAVVGEERKYLSQARLRIGAIPVPGAIITRGFVTPEEEGEEREENDVLGSIRIGMRIVVVVGLGLGVSVRSQRVQRPVRGFLRRVL